MAKKLTDYFKKQKAVVVEPTKIIEEEIIPEKIDAVDEVIIDELIHMIKDEKPFVVKTVNNTKSKESKNALKNDKMSKDKSKKTYIIIFSDKSEGYTNDKNFKKEGLEVLSCNEVTEILPFIPFL